MEFEATFHLGERRGQVTWLVESTLKKVWIKCRQVYEYVLGESPHISNR